MAPLYLKDKSYRHPASPLVWHQLANRPRCKPKTRETGPYTRNYTGPARSKPPLPPGSRPALLHRDVPSTLTATLGGGGRPPFAPIATMYHLTLNPHEPTATPPSMFLRAPAPNGTHHSPFHVHHPNGTAPPPAVPPGSPHQDSLLTRPLTPSDNLPILPGHHDGTRPGYPHPHENWSSPRAQMAPHHHQCHHLPRVPRFRTTQPGTPFHQCHPGTALCTPHPSTHNGNLGTPADYSSSRPAMA
ncbi:unnamed protein product [Dicrocoelium dendriticum]|nr:unnamed protein product [Dicrocoelium dendriticum]